LLEVLSILAGRIASLITHELPQLLPITAAMSPASPRALPVGVDVRALGCLISSMTPDQLNALGAMAQQASVDEAPSKGQLMGGLMGILAGQSATVRMEEGRGSVKQFADGVAKETAPLVKRTKVCCY
jgi:hypothetical protein